MPQIATDLAVNGSVRIASAGPLAARIIAAPATIDDPVYVRVTEGVQRGAKRGPFPWISTNRMPVVGDRAILIPAERQQVAWVVIAATGDPITGSPSGPAGGALSGTYPNPSLADGSVMDANIAAAAAIAYSKLALANAIVDGDISDAAAIAEEKLNLASDAAAGTPSRRSLGTGATQAAAGNDSRLSNARTPTGPAGGALAGTYPNPTLADPEAVTNIGAGGSSYASGWRTFSTAGFGTAGFYKDRDRVYLVGLVEKTSAIASGERMFTLPAGYRPSVDVPFITISGSALGRIDAQASGAVVVNVGDPAWVNLNGLSFRL